MKDLKRVELDEMESTGSYVDSCNETIIEMQEQIDKGYDIVWSTNERWCTIGNKTFNVAKTLFNTWVHENRLTITIK
jgi:hypothetical protein